MFRIRMNLENPNVQLRQNMNAINRSNMAPKHVAVHRPVALNAPMIDRVHKTRPGCSACGKKVA
jgi:hypothetical protein